MAIEKWVVNPGESRVIDLELVRKLKVSLIGGKVDLIAPDEPGARVEVSSVSGKDRVRFASAAPACARSTRESPSFTTK